MMTIYDVRDILRVHRGELEHALNRFTMNFFRTDAITRQDKEISESCIKKLYTYVGLPEPLIYHLPSVYSLQRVGYWADLLIFCIQNCKGVKADEIKRTKFIIKYLRIKYPKNKECKVLCQLTTKLIKLKNNKDPEKFFSWLPEFGSSLHCKLADFAQNSISNYKFRRETAYEFNKHTFNRQKYCTIQRKIDQIACGCIPFDEISKSLNFQSNRYFDSLFSYTHSILEKIEYFHSFYKTHFKPGTNWIDEIQKRFNLPYNKNCHLGIIEFFQSQSRSQVITFLEYTLAKKLNLEIKHQEKFSCLMDLIFHCNHLYLHKDFCLVGDHPKNIHLDQNRLLHNDKGPALEWRDGTKHYAIHGIQVEEKIIEKPQEITIQDILNERNLEIRRVMLDKFTYPRFIKESQAKRIHKDHAGELYHIQMPTEREIFAIVKVINSTPESDGSHKEYFLRVNPRCRTAKQAVASTFNLTSKAYNPTKET